MRAQPDAPGSETIRVLLADDEPMVCAHLRTILGSAPDLEIVGVAHDGAAAVAAVELHRPRVVLMDLRMPGMDGIAATAKVAALPEPPVVVALTTFDADRWVLGALQAGAAGFVVKSTAPEDLIDLVRVAAAGHTVLSPQAAQRLLALTAHGTATDRFSALTDRERTAGERLTDRERTAGDRLAALTDRERDVLALIGDGRSNAEIAARLHLTEATIKGYVSNLLIKLGCENRTQAARIAFQSGLHAAGRRT